MVQCSEITVTDLDKNPNRNAFTFASRLDGLVFEGEAEKSLQFT